MDYKEFNVAVPIRQNNVVIIDGLVQHDTANIVNARLMDGTEPFDFTGYTEVFLEILKPDGKKIQTCVTDDPAINDANNPYRIQIIEPKEGRISFTLQGQATVLEGTHFMQIVIMGDGKRLSASRMNYYVGDVLLKDMGDIGSSDEFTSLLTLINRNSAIAAEERNRTDAETQRWLAENKREERIHELEVFITNYLNNAVGYVESSQDYMERAQMFAELAQNPSAAIIADLVTELDLASETFVIEKLGEYAGNYDAGTYKALAHLLQVRRGNDVDKPALADGELGWSSDAHILYAGSAAGNIPINGTYQASTTAPERKDILWIDLSAGAVIKYWNGASWQPTATATFA